MALSDVSETCCLGISFILCLFQLDFKFNPPVNIHRVFTVMEPNNFLAYTSLLIFNNISTSKNGEVI